MRTKVRALINLNCYTNLMVTKRNNINFHEAQDQGTTNHHQHIVTENTKF